MKAILFFGFGAALLVGCGGSDNGSDCALTVNYCNVQPVGNAGAPQNVMVGSTVALNGSNSSDANGNPLTYSWTLVSAPSTSRAALASPRSARPTFVPDVIGDYVVSLTVNDGKENGAPVTTTITASYTNLSITQSSFLNGSTIPARFAAFGVGGSNISPQLSIGDIPAATDRFAIVMDDENAPCQEGLGACRHWGVFNIPVSKTFIGEGEDLLLQRDVVYGTNYTGSIGYIGPSSNANSRHTYKLTVYALSFEAPYLRTVHEYNRAKFELDFHAYILGKATITGVYP